jgi:hypothetical protein
MYIYGGGAFPVGGGAVLPTTSAFYALVNDNGSLGTWNPTASMPDVATGFGTNSVLRNNEILVPHGAYLSWSQFMD